MIRQVDVAIIGSGPAGATAALQLARSQHSVLLLDRARNHTGWKVGEGLPPAAKPLLQQLGVWQRFLADKHLPSYGNRAVWGAEQPIDHDFIFDPNGTGWHLERRRFDAMLVDAAVAAGATQCNCTQIATCQSTQTGWQLEMIADGQFQCVKATWVIDASGRASWFAKRQGITRQHDDRLVGGVARFSTTTQTDCDSLTWVEAVSDGWWYAALLPHQKLVVAYLSDADLVAANRLSTVSAWTAHLKRTQQMQSRLDAHDYQLDCPPRLLSANSSRLQTPIGNGWLAVGDAAAAFDPLASQGIITALHTGLQAAKCIQRALEDREALFQYAYEIDSLYRRYLVDRTAYYAMEKRWSSSPFWQRRQ